MTEEIPCLALSYIDNYTVMFIIRINNNEKSIFCKYLSSIKVYFVLFSVSKDWTQYLVDIDDELASILNLKFTCRVYEEAIFLKEYSRPFSSTDIYKEHLLKLKEHNEKNSRN